MTVYVSARAAWGAGVRDDLNEYLATERLADDVLGMHLVSPTCFVLVVGLRDEDGKFYLDPADPMEQAKAIRPVTPLFVMPDDLYCRLQAIGEPSAVRAA